MDGAGGPGRREVTPSALPAARGGRFTIPGKSRDGQPGGKREDFPAVIEKKSSGRVTGFGFSSRFYINRFHPVIKGVNDQIKVNSGRLLIR
jgi:hypothetical protein